MHKNYFSRLCCLRNGNLARWFWIQNMLGLGNASPQWSDQSLNIISVNKIYRHHHLDAKEVAICRLVSASIIRKSPEFVFGVSVGSMSSHSGNTLISTSFVFKKFVLYRFRFFNYINMSSVLQYIQVSFSFLFVHSISVDAILCLQKCRQTDFDAMTAPMFYFFRKLQQGTHILDWSVPHFSS